MGSIGDMFTPSKGTSFKANTLAPAAVDSKVEGYNPQSKAQWQSANIQNPFSAGTAQGIQGQTQGTIGQQQSFINALQNQGGVGNQASVFGQQQMLANQLGQQAMGGGPNPALAQLSQATSNNIKNQAALMAGQRGASHNAGMLAKQASDQGMMAQQQAAGQAATMRAQQQLAAQQALQAQQASMANLSTQQVGQQAAGLNTLGNLNLANQQQVLGSLASQNQANVSMQENINNIRAQESMQNNSIGAQMAQQANQIRLQQALGTAQGQSGVMNAQAGIAGANIQGQGAVLGGLMQGGGAAVGMMGAAHGGMIPGYASGGDVAPMALDHSDWSDSGIITPDANAANVAPSDPNGPVSSFGKSLAGLKDPKTQNPLFNGSSMFAQGIGQGVKNFMNRAPDYSSTNAGAGEGAAMNMAAQTAARGGQIKTVGAKLKSGGGVPGKAKVSGDSLKNDTVHAKLSPGEIVIPRSVINSKDPVKGAADFVAAILSRQGK